MKKKEHILTILLLLLISTIFLFTRLYKIDQIPQSLYWDEASIAVNAYSVLKTGRDEWGQFLPIHFQAFGEYKLPVYIYSVALFQSIIGLNEIAVRLPAVFFSLGSLIIIFLLTTKIFLSKKVALLSAFLFAISPWMFLFSRAGYEMTAGLMFFLLAIYLVLLGEKKPYLFIGASGSFLLSLYSYNSFRVLLPFVGLYFLVYFLSRKRELIIKYWQIIITALVIFLIGIIPIINIYFFSDGLKRLDAVGIYESGESKKVLAQTLISNYIDSYNLSFLFLTGDQNLRSHTGESGQLYWLQFPFIILGLIYLFRRRRNINGWQLFIFYLLLIAPIPAVITKEVPHSLRSVLLIVPFSILSGLGIFYLSRLPKYPNFLVLASVFLFGFLFSVFCYRFLTVYPEKSAQHWQYEYSQFFSAYSEKFVEYDQVIVSDRYSQPYVYYMFYGNIDPKVAQEKRVLNELPRSETSLVKQIGNVYFQEIHLEDLPRGKSLIFAHPTEQLDELNPIETIWNPDKTVASYLYEYNLEL